MSPQLLELLFLAGIAFIVINKLIATLGTTDPNNTRTGKSFFGEKGQMKDVTPLYDSKGDNKTTLNSMDQMKDYLAEDNENLRNAIGEIEQKSPSFKITNFIRNSKNAFQMILESANSTSSDLSELVDKRYIDKMRELAPSYGDFINGINNLEAKISEAYSFGNSLFIKVLFSGKNITQNCQNLKEEWTFSKNLLQNSPIWYLNNIDKI